jgi:hypothetical protein
VIEFLQANWLTLVFVAGIAAFYILFDGIDALVGKGQPVIVEVFSNT